MIWLGFAITWAILLVIAWRLETLLRAILEELDMILSGMPKLGP